MREAIALPGCLAATAFVLLGCTDWNQVLRQRASFEMGCPEGQLEITNLGGAQRGVSGCDCRAVYIAVGPSWALNSVSGENCQMTASDSSGGEAQ